MDRDSSFLNILKTTDYKSKDKIRKYLTLLICGSFTAISGFLLLPFITPAFRKICLPFVPATNNQLKKINYMLSKYGIQNEPLIDLGSGDGRVVLSVGENRELKFSKLHGIEINRPLVWYSRYSALTTKIPATFIRGNIWNYKLNSYNNLVIFGVDTMMNELEIKLNKELPKEFCVIACRYPFPNWTPVEIIESGYESIWCYKSNKI